MGPVSGADGDGSAGDRVPGDGPQDVSDAPLPADSHVHTEFSWDAAAGDMAATCARAVELGLATVSFTEHVDPTEVVVLPHELPHVPEHVARHLGDDLVLRAPALDVEAYLAAVERCRERFPGLRILTGLEISEPHWHPEAVAALVVGGRFDRLLGSLHSLLARGGAADSGALLVERGPDVLHDYLAEAHALATSSAPVGVLAHLDYPLRGWRQVSSGPFDVVPFETEFREVLGALAGSGRALEINTVLPLDPRILRWWRECGGRELTFGSDAHRPDDVARGFAAAARLAQACGFRPGPAPHDPWRRS